MVRILDPGTLRHTGADRGLEQPQLPDRPAAHRRYRGKMATSGHYVGTNLGDPDSLRKLAQSQGVPGEKVEKGSRLEGAIRRGRTPRARGVPTSSTSRPIATAAAPSPPGTRSSTWLRRRSVRPEGFLSRAGDAQMGAAELQARHNRGYSEAGMCKLGLSLSLAAVTILACSGVPEEKMTRHELAPERFHRC